MLAVIRKYAALLVIGVLCWLPVVVSAATTTTNKSKSSSSTASGTDANGDQAVIQGYSSDDNLQKGMIVRLDAKNSKKVVALTSDNILQMLGVVVAPNDAAVALSNNGNSNQVFVSSCCHYPVLVSNQNGPIKVGDYITVSALAGIGMKVDTTQPIALGKATSSFDGTSGVVASAKLKDSTGKEIPVSIGQVSVNISISHNPLQQISEKNLPGFLSQVSQNIAGKAVGATRVYIALAVLVVSAFIAGWVLYSGVRGGLIAMGRNPFAKKTILRGIFRVVLAGIIIFLVGMFGVYLLLRL